MWVTLTIVTHKEEYVKTILDNSLKVSFRILIFSVPRVFFNMIENLDYIFILVELLVLFIIFSEMSL